MVSIAALFLDAWRRFADDDGWAISSHIALAALTSMFPFLIFLTALAGFVGSAELAAQATAILLETWPQRVAGPLAQEIHAVLTQGRSGLLTFGIVLAVYFSSNAVEALRIGLNRAYDQIDPRPWWLLRLESIAYVLLGAATMLALGLLLVLGPLLFATAVKYAPGLADLQQTVTLARYAIVALLLGVSLVVAHKYIAAGRRPLKAIAPGIALTLVLSLVFAEGFGRYLAEFSGNYVTTYAGLASVMIALVFLYTLAAIFVYGAELNGAMLSAREGGNQLSREPKASKMLASLLVRGVMAKMVRRIRRATKKPAVTDDLDSLANLGIETNSQPAPKSPDSGATPAR